MSFKILIKTYEQYLANNKIKVNASIWFVIAFIFGVAALALIYFLFSNIIVSIVTFFAIVDLIIGMPVYLENERIAKIENQLPNALREMAYILKSGGTYEYALREVTRFDYGPLTQELEKVLVRLEEGSNFEEAFNALGQSVDSNLVRKVVAIVIDSVRAGAGLADVLEEIAEDARKIYKLEQDRKAKTTMQVLFICASGAIIAPAIFGLVITIVEFLLEISIQTKLAGQDVINQAISSKNIISSALMIYIFFEAVASSLMIAMMRDKKISKTIMYFPLFLLSAYILYFAVMFAAKGLLTGML